MTVTPAPVVLSEADHWRGCVHEAGHAAAAFLLSAELGSTIVSVSLNPRPALLTQSIGITEMARKFRMVRTIRDYHAEIVMLLSGIAAEKVFLGEISDGAGGSATSDLHAATLLAAKTEFSLGIGKDLTTLSQKDTDLLPLLRDDPAARKRVKKILDTCLGQAIRLVEANRLPVERIATAVRDNGSIPGALVAQYFEEAN